VIIIFKAQIVKLYTTVEIAWRVFGVRWVPIKGLLFFSPLTFVKLHSLTHILSGKFSILFCNGRRGGGASICRNWSRVSWTAMITQFTLRTRLFMLFLPSMIWSAPLLAQPTWIMHPFLHTFDALSLVTWWQILLSWPLDRFSFFRHQDSIFFSLSRIKNLFHILERKGETYKYTRYHLIKRKVLKKGWEFKSEH